MVSARACPDRVTRTPSTTRSRGPATSGEDVVGRGPATVTVCRSRMLLIDPWRANSVWKSYVPAVGNVSETASSPGRPVGSGWTCANVPRSSRVAMRCIHTSWVRVRSVTGDPVSASRRVTTTRVALAGPRVSAGTGSRR